MKKILAICLTLVLVFAVCPMGMFTLTANAATSGTTGDCTWTLDGTVLTISGNGKMGNYNAGYSNSDYTTPWGRSITEVIIENGVTNIGAYAFYDCERLTLISISNSVTSINHQAFTGCTSLTSIFIPNSVTSIGANAFKSCISLTSIAIPDSVTSIGGYVFSRCDSLASVTMGDGLTSIGEHAFVYCTSLSSITIGKSVTSICEGAFQYCSSLTSITIPDSVTSIGLSVFLGCYSLKKVYYGGTKEQWRYLKNYNNINGSNNTLYNASVKYCHSYEMVKEGSVRHEGVDENGNYQSAGIRFKSRVSGDFRKSATELGFVAVPTALLGDMTIAEYVALEDNQALTAKVKGDGIREVVYAVSTDENGQKYYDYQMMIKGLTREGVDTNLLDTEIAVAMYAVVDGEVIYTDIVSYSYNQFVAATSK